MTRFHRAVFSNPARLSVRLVLQTLFLHLTRIAALTTLSRRRRKPVLGILSARTPVIAIVLVTTGLARCQNPPKFILPDNLGLTLATLSDKSILNICTNKFETTYQSVEFYQCFNQIKKAQSVVQAFYLTPGNEQATPSRLAGGSRAEASDSSTSTFAPTLESSVPTLPFLGNWLTFLSWVPNATTAADATVAYTVVLTRQSDCSLDEEYVLPGAGLPDAEYLTSLTGAQDYFHQISGLTTTPDVFANGCPLRCSDCPLPV